MKLSDKQALFADLLVDLIDWTKWEWAAHHEHRQARIRFGWVYDPPGKTGSSRSIRSLHRSRLAADLMLDLWDKKQGQWIYQRSTAAYRPLGERWESMHELCEWGGSGNRNDGNHFSLRHGGRW